MPFVRRGEVINNIAEVRRLLDDGANPNQADADGITALMHAAFAMAIHKSLKRCSMAARIRIMQEPMASRL